MSDYDDDELDDELDNDEQAAEAEPGEPRRGGNRNFLIALGILASLFVLVTVVLVVLYLSRRGGGETADISATNQVIQTANAQTAIAATLTSAARAAALQTSAVGDQATDTPAPVKVTPTSVLAQPTATNTPEPAAGGPGLATATANLQTQTAAAGQTQSAPSALTQAVQTQTSQAAINLTATATALPQTGFAEDIGLPGLFGVALGLIVVIVLVRRLRISTSS